ncbi:MAG: 1-acyl-sn-glycerol-3-phosphate acyltransferase [Microthrixaceae bacterium]
MRSPLIRRLVTVPATCLIALLLAVLAPLALPVLAVADLVRGRRRLPLVRGWLFGLAYGALESVMLVVVGLMWVATGFGRAMNGAWSQRMHARLQHWWIRRLLNLLSGLLGLRFSIEGAEAVSPGPVIVFGRHVSLVDTLFPALALSESGMALRYVLKRELEIMPLLDVVGHRLPNYFADRSGTDTAGELAALSSLASGLSDTDSVVIFPEGTRGTPAKRARAVERLSETHPELTERAAALRHTMPPRWGGAFALLDAAPAADVAVFVHYGLDGLSGLRSILAALPFQRSVAVELWRIPRCDIPEDRDERREWLFELWDRVDDWVDRQVTGAPVAGGRK